MRVLGRPTHYTRQFDSDGRPMAVSWAARGSNSDVGGKLPAGWCDQFWDWQPRFDEAGAWVELHDKRRDAQWAQAKRDRAAAMDAGVEVTLPGGDVVTIQTDEASAAAIERAASRLARAEDGATIAWALADNSLRPLTRADAEALADAITDHRAAIHAESQAVRAALFAADPQD